VLNGIFYCFKGIVRCLEEDIQQLLRGYDEIMPWM